VVVKPYRFKSGCESHLTPGIDSADKLPHWTVEFEMSNEGISNNGKSPACNLRPHPEECYVDAGKPAPWKNRDLWWYAGKNLHRYRPTSAQIMDCFGPHLCLDMPCPYKTVNDLKKFAVYVHEETVYEDGKPVRTVCRCKAHDYKTQIKCLYQASPEDCCPACGEQHYCSSIHAHYAARVTIQEQYGITSTQLESKDSLESQNTQTQGFKKNYYYCPTQHCFFAADSIVQ
jgi:hypothetical protein